MKKVFTCLLIGILCFVNSGCFINDWFKKDKNDVNLETVLTYFNQVIDKTLDSEPESFTIKNKNSTKTLVSTYDKNSGTYISNYDASENKYEEAFVPDYYTTNYAYFGYYGDTKNVYVADLDCIKYKISEKLKVLFNDFYEYYGLNLEEINTLLKKEKEQELIKLEEEKNIVENVEVKFDYKALENNKYTLSHTIDTLYYDSYDEKEYEVNQTMTYTFDKDKIYQVKKDATFNGIPYVDLDLYTIDIEYNYDNSIYNQFFKDKTINAGNNKISKHLFVYLDEKSIGTYLGITSYDTNVDNYLNSLSQEQDFDLENVTLYQFVEGDEATSSYVEGKKLSYNTSYINIVKNPSNDKAKVMVNYYFKVKDFTNRAKYKIIKYPYYNKVEEVDLGTYNIEITDDNYSFNDKILVNGEEIEGTSIELNESKIYVVECYLNIDVYDQKVQVNYYFQDELLAYKEDYYEGKNFSFIANVVDKYSIKVYKDKDLTNPYQNEDKIHKETNFYLDFKVKEGYCYFLVIDKKSSYYLKSPEYYDVVKYIKLYEYKIDEIDKIEIKLSSETPVINGINVNEQDDLYIEEYTLKANQLENQKLYVIVTDYVC